jgi:hypothetical protein
MEAMTSVLLQEIRGMREEMREFKDEVASWRQDNGERLVKVETVVKPALMTNGQPSQISLIDNRVSALEKSWTRVVAVGAAVWALITLASHWIPWGRH